MDGANTDSGWLHHHKKKTTRNKSNSIRKFERSDGKSLSRGKGFRERVTWTYFHISAQPYQKYKKKTTRNKSNSIRKFERCDDKSLSRRKGFRERVT